MTRYARGLWAFAIVILMSSQHGLRAPVGVPSAKRWASKSRVAAKIYKDVPEHNYTSLVAKMWRKIRNLRFEDVRRMNGRFGLIAIIRSIYQANVLAPADAEEGFRVLMEDASRVLSALRAAGPPPSVVAPSPRRVLDVLNELDEGLTQTATDVIERFAAQKEADVIEIEDEKDESPPKKDGKDGDDRSGGASASPKSSRKRKTSGGASSSKAPSPKKSR